VAEVSFSILGSAARFRDANIAQRTRDEARLAGQTALQNRVDDVARRKQIAAAEVQRTAQSIRDRRNDNETDVSRRLKLDGQRQANDIIASDTRLTRTRNDLTAERNNAREDQAATLALIERGQINALTQNAVDTLRNDQASRPNFQSFLRERDQRQTQRQIEQRDAQIQQRIDLRIATDNLRAASPGSTVPRGSIVDVSG